PVSRRQTGVGVEPEPRVIARRHRTVLHLASEVVAAAVTARVIGREVQRPPPLLHMVVDPPRDGRHVLIPVIAGLVAMAVVAGSHRKRAGARAVPRWFL